MIPKDWTYRHMCRRVPGSSSLQYLHEDMHGVKNSK